MGRSRPPALLLVPAALVAAGTLIPLVYLAARALERGWPFVVEELVQPRTAALVGRSLLLVERVRALQPLAHGSHREVCMQETGQIVVAGHRRKELNVFCSTTEATRI